MHHKATWIAIALAIFFFRFFLLPQRASLALQAHLFVEVIYFPRTNSYASLLLSDTVIGYFVFADLIEKIYQLQVIGLLPYFYY